MPEKDRIMSLLKEAEIYHVQGLLDQAAEKYNSALDLIRDDVELAEDKTLLHSVEGKIQTLNQSRKDIEMDSGAPELSEDVQNLISRLFSFSKNREVASIEGAVALAKFGQYDKALVEFEKLIKKGKLPVTAAKNMLRCHLVLGSPDAAIAQFKRWKSRDLFTYGELDNLYTFLENILTKEGVKISDPEIADLFPNDRRNGKAEEILLEILSIRLTLDHGILKKQTFDLDVAFQLGNTVSLIINADQNYLAEVLKPGVRLKRIQCYSSESVYNAMGYVSETNKITSGPRCGDYSLGLRVEGPEQFNRIG